MKEVRYNYSWGNEDVLSASITVIQTGNADVYEIVLVQEGFRPESFQSIKSEYNILSCNVTERVRKDHDGMIESRMHLIVKSVCNPKPETLFELY